LASAAIAFPRRRSLRGLALLAAALMIGAVGWLSTTSVGSSTVRSSAETSVQSRQEMLRTSLKAAKDFMPLGSGVGSFRRVYALYEAHDQLDPTTYVNHAHDDYVELAVETGLPGLVLLGAFLLWWAKAVWAAWRRTSPDPYALAASVASAAVLLHSLVDFPLRTSAIAATFALCLVLLVRQRPAPAEPAQLRPTRHVVID
jgi:O-antigen ligase